MITKDFGRYTLDYGYVKVNPRHYYKNFIINLISFDLLYLYDMTHTVVYYE